jgi:DNA polymerase III epsilon subunit-like protein
MIVIDFETTGLLLHPSAELRKQPKIIEAGFALLCRETGEVLETINLLINPGVKLPAEIIKITGITDADLEGKPSFKEVLPQIAAMFLKANVMVAHNLPFDQGMLRTELQRLGATEDFPWPQRGICTVGLYREQYGKNPRLIELYEDVIGHPLAQTHRALDDAMAVVEIIQKEKLWNL